MPGLECILEVGGAPGHGCWHSLAPATVTNVSRSVRTGSAPIWNLTPSHGGMNELLRRRRMFGIQQVCVAAPELFDSAAFHVTAKPEVG